MRRNRLKSTINDGDVDKYHQKRWNVQINLINAIVHQWSLQTIFDGNQLLELENVHFSRFYVYTASTFASIVLHTIQHVEQDVSWYIQSTLRSNTLFLI